MFLLDRNVVSELRRAKPHGAVLAWVAAQQDRDLHVSAVTIGELHAGVEITREQDPEKAGAIEAWLDQVAQSYNVLAMDAVVFRVWAKLMHGQSDQLLEDAMIAATAKVHGLTVVTRNVRDFQALGSKTLNPFQPAK
jgi:toxin FitB